MLWQQALMQQANVARPSLNSKAVRADVATSNRLSSNAAREEILLESASSDDPESDDAEEDEDGVENDACTQARSCYAGGGRRLWDADSVYPMGVSNWSDAANCAAAAAYECPCGRQCLSFAGGVIKVYEHRRELRALAKQTGGMRDTVRRHLSQHFDASMCHFTNTFVVGDCAHVCERAFAVGSGISETTFARARTDVMQDRAWHSERASRKERRKCDARRELDGWVRLQRETMEGDKISGQKWYTEKTTAKALWSRYVASCDRAKQPTVGNMRLLHTLWREHKEFKTKPPTGHAICSLCGDFASRRLTLQKYHDAGSRQMLSELDAKIAAHHTFHVAERQYYDDAVARATHIPSDVTTITIDAPTKHQFDLPSQARATRDTVKRLDGSSRWHSKLEGVLDAGVLAFRTPCPHTHQADARVHYTRLTGVGMLVFLAREALGGGPNLVCTVLLLTLYAHVEFGRPLGTKLHLQLDNTTSENKNTTVLGFVSLLVAWGVFTEASIFFLPVGHTYNELDAAFSPLIDSLLSTVVPTVSSLMDFIPVALQTKRVRLVRNLPHVWDFTSYLKQHMHAGIGGFTVTQQSSGMHEFYINRDLTGEVRMKCRQSSQSTTWFPEEGDGDPIFVTVPDRAAVPPIAKIASDASWEKASVAVNVRRWLPFLGLSCEELNKATAEWESMFNGLPLDGDIAQLSEDQLLTWVPLAQREDIVGQHSLRLALAGGVYTHVCVARCVGVLLSCLRACCYTAETYGGEDQIENPPVNPITGANRTAATVRRELREHNSLLRHSCPLPPIFLSDHIFFQVRGKGVQLGRVTHAPFGGALKLSDCIDVTEYVHAPQPDVHGFFGTFKPLQNPHHDSTQRNSLQFVRHRDVSRKDVLVFNVQTFGSASEKRVRLSSLKELATALPQEFRLPDPIPSSHKEHEEHSPDPDEEEPPLRRRRVVRPRQPVDSERLADPLAKPGDKIEVYWTDDPVGWFKAVVLQNKQNDGVWVTKVRYEACAEWRSHTFWHCLDASYVDHVTWRFCADS